MTVIWFCIGQRQNTSQEIIKQTKMWATASLTFLMVSSIWFRILYAGSLLLEASISSNWLLLFVRFLYFECRPWLLLLYFRSNSTRNKLLTFSFLVVSWLVPEWSPRVGIRASGWTSHGCSCWVDKISSRRFSVHGDIVTIGDGMCPNEVLFAFDEKIQKIKECIQYSCKIWFLIGGRFTLRLIKTNISYKI